MSERYGRGGAWVGARRYRSRVTCDTGRRRFESDPRAAIVMFAMSGSLQAVDLSIEVGGRPVLEGASFTLGPGDKVGLVGRNGAGKTSLLKVLSGEGAPIGGTIARRGDL